MKLENEENRTTIVLQLINEQNCKWHNWTSNDKRCWYWKQRRSILVLHDPWLLPLQRWCPSHCLRDLPEYHAGVYSLKIPKITMAVMLMMIWKVNCAGSCAIMSGSVGDRWGCLGVLRQVLSNFTQMDLVIILTSILIISILEIVNWSSDEHWTGGVAAQRGIPCLVSVLQRRE